VCFEKSVKQYSHGKSEFYTSFNCCIVLDTLIKLFEDMVILYVLPNQCTEYIHREQSIRYTWILYTDHIFYRNFRISAGGILLYFRFIRCWHCEILTDTVKLIQNTCYMCVSNVCTWLHMFCNVNMTRI
jgi:hypothetical protein